jgi:hypothetical protein
MQAENARIHPGLKIVKVYWLGQTLWKNFAPLVVEVDTAGASEIQLGLLSR